MKKNWSIDNSLVATQIVTLNGWEYIDDFIREEMLDYSYFVWRGQSDLNWLLRPSLDRVLEKTGKLFDNKIRKLHLEKFKYATRGRRGTNPPLISNENDWWALGQHNGLVTPLLDWTTSPFVAAYFAFIEEFKDDVEYCAVFGIQKSAIISKSKQINKLFKGEGRPPIIEFIEPLSDENPRLVNQGGLFTRSPDGQDIESWISTYYKKPYNYIRIVKILIPTSDRLVCLRSLNRMNINNLSLFPDLFGASQYSNNNLIIENY